MEHNPFTDDTFLARWLAGELTPDELETLQQREDYAALAEIIEELKGLEAPEFPSDLVWQKLQEKFAGGKNSAQGSERDADRPSPRVTKEGSPRNPEPETRNQKPLLRRLTPWKYVTAIAAAVALILAALWWLQGGEYPVAETVVTQAGEQEKVELPDGSTVTLNALSSLGYSSEKWPSNRYVVLEGEGYFKAKKGRHFTVQTKQGQVQIVGTIFNVYARDAELEVKCTQGTVQVINPEATERVLLKKGEQVSVLNGRMQKRRGLAFYPAWYKGESTFREAPLQKVLDEMGRQYGLVVLADSMGERSFSGKFVHKNLSKALKMVCGPMQLEYTLTGDTLRVALK
jgi:transmembrane sensor